MPTVILLDSSLSMSRPLHGPNDVTSESRLSLAKMGLRTFLDYTVTNNRLEFTSLIIFSSLYEVKKPFTRDYPQLKQALIPIEVFDKTNMEIGLLGLSTVVLEEWGSGMPCQVILITDGRPGSGDGSLPSLLQSDTALLPLPFEHSLHIILLASPAELQESMPVYTKFTEANHGGTIHTIEGQPTIKNIQNVFHNVAEKCHAPFEVTLSCGNLNSRVQMFPPPNFELFDEDLHVLSDDFKLCGFLNSVDVSSPPTVSRHLVIPVGESKKGQADPDPTSGTDSDSAGGGEDGRVPSLCVLLHGSIRVENMIAVVQVGPSWYGIIYSWADSKKKANLILALFEPGTESIPWLGRFDLLGPCSAFESNPYGEEGNQLSPFPVRPSDKRSYSSNPVVWVRSGSLQSDIQKCLRYARKLPDKMALFYKELNRIRRAAMAFGMKDLLQGLSEMLERECTLLPGTAHPDAALQLTHAARMITLSVNKEYSYIITPMSTNFILGT